MSAATAAAFAADWAATAPATVPDPGDEDAAAAAWAERLGPAIETAAATVPAERRAGVRRWLTHHARLAARLALGHAAAAGDGDVAAAAAGLLPALEERARALLDAAAPTAAEMEQLRAIADWPGQERRGGGEPH